MSIKNYYINSIVPALIKEFGLKNPIMVPKLDKITLNMGLGEKGKNKKYLEESIKELSLISGQQASFSIAKAGVADFGIRKGNPIGAIVTLRKVRMYEFLERLIYIAIPRIRDFRGFSKKSFDKHNNYSIGIKQHIIFPEIDIDKISEIKGLNINFIISSRTRQESIALLKHFSFPIRL